MHRFRQIVLILGFCLLQLANSGRLVQAHPSNAPAADDPLIASEVLDQGSNALLVTSEPYCTTPRDPNNSQPYPYSPKNCPQNPIKPGNEVQLATFQQVYKQLGNNGPTQNFVLGNRQEEQVEQNQAAVGRRNMDAMAVDLTGQGIDTFVSAWEGPTQTIKVYISQPISTTLSEQRLTSAGPLAPGSSGDQNGHIHLAAGDLTGDGAEEFVVAYQGADAKIHLDLYANRGDALPQLLASVAAEGLPLEPKLFARFAVTIGDFDGDTNAELALVYVQPHVGLPGDRSKWQLFLRVYDLVGTTLTPKVGAQFFIAPPEPNGTSLGAVNLAMSSGDFDKDGKAELAVVSGAQRTVQDFDPGGDDTFIHLLKLGDDPSTPTVDLLEKVTVTTQTNLDVLVPEHNTPTDIAAADLNNDGHAEVILALGPQLYLYSVDALLKATQRLHHDAMPDGLPALQRETYTLGYNFLGVRHVGGGRVEIAIALPTIFPESGSARQEMNLVVYTAASNLQSLTVVAKALQSNPIITEPGDYRHFALAVGGPNHLRLGNYTHRGTVTQISQPLVVVKAPPTHYDQLGGETFDVSDCYGSDVRFACGGLNNKFTVTFTQGNEKERSISTQLNSDWAISENLGGSLSAVGIELTTSLQRKYGEGFEKIEGTKATFTDVTEDYVWQDDRILASVVDYDVYEFEVLANEVLVGHVLVVRPRGTPQLTWFGAKDWTGFAFTPDSQPGNILSYAESVEEIRTQGNFAEPIMPLSNLQAQTISRDTSFGTVRTVTYKQDVDQSASKTRTLELEVGAKLKGAREFGKVTAGLEVGIENSYKTAELSTQKVTIGEFFSAKIVYGNVNAQLADANYRVTPFVYWASNGAVMVDFAVQPELSRPGFPAGWWQQHYGDQPDPTFLLPWRYEPDRLGYATPDYKLNLTKDILFDPPNAQALEVVTITARIHNYSLRATSTPPTVRFYLGDPAIGGTPLIGVNGETAVTASANLPARGSAIVRFPWRVPEGLVYPRIYAVIDPDQIMTEVHEDNNKAYSILGAYDGSGPPQAGFSPSPASNISDPLTVKFINTSSGDFTGVAWDFGDGSTSTERNPTHTYAQAGDYVVTLRLTGGANDATDLVQQRVNVGRVVVAGERVFLPMVAR